jgi:hypothetical protein
MVTKKLQKVAPDFFCIKCHYNTSKKSSFDKHLTTAKHQLVTFGNAEVALNDSHLYSCEKCNKYFKSRHGLWYHKKKCDSMQQNVTENMTENDIVKILLKENKEFKEIIIDQGNKMIEQSKMMMDFASKNKSTVNNNINTNNNQFNMQFFLNEKCKNAMSITDFVDSIEILDEDFENIGKLGYVQGISNIFIKGLKGLDETVRPIHCSDIKRETLYIKDNNEWNKDENQQKIRRTIALIAHKNLKYIPVWKEANPTSSDVTTKKNDLLMKIMNQVTTCITPDDELGINKIIRNVANNVCINKKT